MSLNNSTKTKENTYEVEVSVDAETFAKACNKAYKKQVKNINVPGFRKGKAPKHMIEKMYGEGVFFEDAMQDCDNFNRPSSRLRTFSSSALSTSKFHPRVPQML